MADVDDAYSLRDLSRLARISTRTLNGVDVRNYAQKKFEQLQHEQQTSEIRQIAVTAARQEIKNRWWFVALVAIGSAILASVVAELVKYWLA